MKRGDIALANNAKCKQKGWLMMPETDKTNLAETTQSGGERSLII